MNNLNSSSLVSLQRERVTVRLCSLRLEVGSVHVCS